MTAALKGRRRYALIGTAVQTFCRSMSKLARLSWFCYSVQLLVYLYDCVSIDRTLHSADFSSCRCILVAALQKCCELPFEMFCQYISGSEFNYGVNNHHFYRSLCWCLHTDWLTHFTGWYKQQIIGPIVPRHCVSAWVLKDYKQPVTKRHSLSVTLEV